MNSSSLSRSYDNKWLHFLATSGNDVNEWGVFVKFWLCGSL